ncbi:DUF6020 family protein [Bifidobacterium imperatoris]|nr:DUF6020 family protein [Bifidobacterium imperatoris]PLS25779.1 glucose-6-phosphate specific signal transduction histidine kinase [Bifidobacterium imperatoris]
MESATSMQAYKQSRRQWWQRNWFIMLPLAVYLATYAVVFPGIDSVDANWQRQMFADWTFSKQHSVLSTFVFGIIGGDQLWLCNLMQSIIFAACIITALAVLAPRVSRRALLIASLAWSFYPLFPAYAVSCVKDVLCAGFTLLLCVEVFAIIDSKGAMLRNPWFLAGLTLTLFVTNEYRKNNFLFIGMIVLFLLIRYRREWKRLLVVLVAFAALTGAWGAYCDYGLKAQPAATTEMLGVPLMQVSYIYYEDLHGNPQHLPAQADAYFQAVRPQAQWAANYEKQRLVVMDNKISDLTGADLGEFLGNWASLCFANFGTCVKAYALFEGSLLNPLQVTDDQYSILGGVLHMDKAAAGQSALAWAPRVVFNLAVIDWMLIALAVLAYRRGMRELLPLFLIPLGIAISLMLAALAVQLRLMLGAIILIPFLAALILGRERRA